MRDRSVVGTRDRGWRGSRCGGRDEEMCKVDHGDLRFLPLLRASLISRGLDSPLRSSFLIDSSAGSYESD